MTKKLQCEDFRQHKGYTGIARCRFVLTDGWRYVCTLYRKVCEEQQKLVELEPEERAS